MSVPLRGAGVDEEAVLRLGAAVALRLMVTGRAMSLIQPVVVSSETGVARQRRGCRRRGRAGLLAISDRVAIDLDADADVADEGDVAGEAVVAAEVEHGALVSRARRERWLDADAVERSGSRRRPGRCRPGRLEVQAGADGDGGAGLDGVAAAGDGLRPGRCCCGS